MGYASRSQVSKNSSFQDSNIQNSSSQRKSFFRRLAESKGSPKIDWEEVLIVRR